MQVGPEPMKRAQKQVLISVHRADSGRGQILIYRCRPNVPCRKIWFSTCLLETHVQAETRGGTLDFHVPMLISTCLRATSNFSSPCEISLTKVSCFFVCSTDTPTLLSSELVPYIRCDKVCSLSRRRISWTKPRDRM